MKWIGKQIDSLAQVTELGRLTAPIVSNSTTTVLECSSSATSSPAIQIEGQQDSENAAYISTINDAGVDFKLMSSANDSNYCTIATGARGETTITTVDSVGTNAHLNLTIDGGLVVSSTGIDISADGKISNAEWLGTTVASAYLDADTAHLSTSKQLTFHNFKVDLDTTKYYIGLTDADSESTDTTQNDLPMVAPVAGKLLKIFIRCNNNASGKTISWRLETQATGVDDSTGPSVVGTTAGAGPTASSIVTIDFTSADSGDNLIDAGDLVFLSLQSAQSTTLSKYFITCLWEWNLG
jgi:hypothetical protein